MHSHPCYEPWHHQEKYSKTGKKAKEIIGHPFSGLCPFSELRPSSGPQGVVSCGLFRDHLILIGVSTVDGSRDGKTILYYPGGPSIIPRVLKSERGRQESQSQRRRCDNVIREPGVLQSEKDSTNHYCLEDEGRGPEAKELG